MITALPRYTFKLADNANLCPAKLHIIFKIEKYPPVFLLPIHWFRIAYRGFLPASHCLEAGS